MKRCGIAWVALGLAALAVPAGAQTLEVSVESREIYAGMPFTLLLSAQGFEEQAPPAAPDLAIDGCRVTYLGMTPSVSQQIQIAGGRRSEWRKVTFVYRWQVTAPSAGRYTVPALTLSQGSKSAASPAAAFDVGDLEQSTDMVIRVRLPQRPVWVGETFDGVVEWLLARDVESYELVVPLFEIDAVRVEGADVGGRTRSFRAGARVIDLPMQQDRLREDGIDYTRISFPFRATATRAQTFDLDPVRVVARLESAGDRGFFGFPSFGRARGALFQASGERHQLVVRPLPESGRPHNFVNAVGGGFSIEVQASRTVVSVGDPIELTLRIRGDGELEGLSLPTLLGEGGLPPTLFSVPATAAVGSVDRQTRTKTFAVTARVLSAEVREIPPIAFAYFDPNRGEYITVSSRPVALSVTGGNVVGAGDVTAVAAPAPTSTAALEPPRAVSTAAFIGADMSLSAVNRTLALPWGSTIAPLPMVLLYLLPLALGGLRVWQMRTAARRGRRREIARARREVERVLKSGGAAREMAPQALNAMRVLARLTGNEDALGARALEWLETSAFDPAAAGEPLDGEIVAAVRALAREWEGRAGPGTLPPSATAALCVVFGAAVALAADASAPSSPETQPLVPATEPGLTMLNDIERARQVYRQALEEQDPVRRARHFADAERSLRGAAASRPAPELVADWGNAALGAGDSGRATLAFRRALAVQPNHERAARNLAWLRDRAPPWLSRPASGGALDSLLFWRDLFSVSQRYWMAGGVFALAVLLLTPWPTRRMRLLRRMSVVPIALWAIAAGSALLSQSAPPEGVVVIDGAPLRSADSAGARLAFAHPLPAGAEVTILETRDGWLRIALADGTPGWIMANSVAAVRQSQSQTDSQAPVSTKR